MKCSPLANDFKTMEPFIMRPPLKFQDDRRFEHGGQEMILFSPAR